MRRRNKSGGAENEVDNNNNNNKNEQSSTATMPGYTFFKSSGRREDSNSATKGYVPSGMSREEYSTIRKMEAEKERKMNYGAWGPRFFRTDRPEGDWMVMPNLWTFGQVEVNRQTGVPGESNGLRPSMRRRIQYLAQVNGPAFWLGYVLVDSLFFCYTLWKLKQIQDSAVIQKTYGLAFAASSLLFSGLGRFFGLAPRLRVLKAPIAKAPIARKTIKSTILGPVALSLIQINALKIAAAMLQIPLWNRLMELSNRRWLWSKKRFTTIASTAMTVATIFGVLLL